MIVRVCVRTVAHLRDRLVLITMYGLNLQLCVRPVADEKRIRPLPNFRKSTRSVHDTINIGTIILAIRCIRAVFLTQYFCGRVTMGAILYRMANMRSRMI